MPASQSAFCTLQQGPNRHGVPQRATPRSAGWSVGRGRRARDPLALSTELTEMGVLEVVVVLEAVAHQPVEADVGDPDQAEREEQRFVLPPADGDDGGS